MEADRLLEHWQDEGDFHFLYQQLAQTDKEPDRKEFLNLFWIAVALYALRKVIGKYFLWAR